MLRDGPLCRLPIDGCWSSRTASRGGPRRPPPGDSQDSDAAASPPLGPRDAYLVTVVISSGASSCPVTEPFVCIVRSLIWSAVVCTRNIAAVSKL